MNNRMAGYCPRCGTPTPTAPDQAEAATVLNADNELVAEEDFNPLPVGILDWTEVGPFLVCPDCVSVEERRRWEGVCIRCGREPYDDDGEPVEWWAGDVCDGCATRDEERQGVLDYHHTLAGSIAETRAREDFGRAGKLGQIDSWDEAIKIMLERGVPNHLHYAHPANPLAGPDEEQPCWDSLSDELQHDVVRCSVHLTEARYGAQERGEAEWWQGVDWWLIERTIRRYVRSATSDT